MAAAVSRRPLTARGESPSVAFVHTTTSSFHRSCAPGTSSPRCCSLFVRSLPSLLVVGLAPVLAGCGAGTLLPNGYKVFFTAGSEASLVKPATKGGECLAGPHVAELGSAGKYIFGRIEPKVGLLPHPDHAPGYFLIDSLTDEKKTGLDEAAWLAELKAVGIIAPELHPPERAWPRH